MLILFEPPENKGFRNKKSSVRLDTTVRDMEENIMIFETKECTNPDIVKELFVEYSHIKGAESCFVSFDKELNDLLGYYSGGAIIVGYEEDKPIACVAIKKISDETCEGKRLFIRPESPNRRYFTERIMIPMK